MDPGAPLCSIDAAQNALLIYTKIMRIQPAVSLLEAFYIKGCSDFGAIFTMTNSASICAVTQRHTQSIQHQRLTGTSFTCYGRSARGKFYFQRLYQSVIIDIYR